MSAAPTTHRTSLSCPKCRIPLSCDGTLTWCDECAYEGPRVLVGREYQPSSRLSRTVAAEVPKDVPLEVRQARLDAALDEIRGKLHEPMAIWRCPQCRRPWASRGSLSTHLRQGHDMRVPEESLLACHERPWLAAWPKGRCTGCRGHEFSADTCPDCGLPWSEYQAQRGVGR